MRFRCVIFALAFVSALFSGPRLIQAATPHATTVSAVISIAGNISMFATEAAAQQHCPRDEVVWLNTRSGIYHEKGMRWYGRTKEGAYVCRKEADAAGYRDTRNGQ